MSDITGIVYDDIKPPDNLLACERPFDVLWDSFLKYSEASISRQASPGDGDPVFSRLAGRSCRTCTNLLK